MLSSLIRMEPNPKPKETWAKLAIRLGFSYETIRQWRDLPDAPEVPDLERWKAYVEVMGLGQVGNKTSKGREDLLKENLIKKNRLLDLEIALKERKVVDRSAVNQMLLRVASLQKTVVFQKLEHELPAKAVAFGAPMDPMRTLGREAAEGICDIFAQEMEKWSNEDE